MNLLILGNGFDLSLGLHTSFKSFINYCKEHRNDDVEFLNNLYTLKLSLWSDFESKLLDMELYPQKLINSFGGDAKSIRDLYTDMFISWFAEEIEDQIEKLEDITLPSFINDEDFVISFNYSKSLLDKIFHQNRILCLHGQINQEAFVLTKCFDLEDKLNRNNPILGTSPDNLNDNIFIKNAVALIKDTEKIYKDNHNKIKAFCDKIEKIIVYGCSCNLIDYPYLKKISYEFNKPMIIYCYDDDTYNRAKFYENNLLNVQLIKCNN